MRLRVWRFVTLVLAALSMGMAWAHALELGPKMSLSAADYIIVQQIYQEFGRVGAVIEPAAILAAVILVILVRKRRPAFGLSLAGAALLAVAFAVWLAYVLPANGQLAIWDAAGERPDWIAIRRQSEFAHAARLPCNSPRSARSLPRCWLRPQPARSGPSGFGVKWRSAIGRLQSQTHSSALLHPCLTSRASAGKGRCWG